MATNGILGKNFKKLLHEMKEYIFSTFDKV